MSAGLAREGFDIDLAEGVKSEGELLRIFLGGLVEVKTDHKAEYTGNLFIEMRQPDPRNPGKQKPSGILVSDANWWAFRFWREGRARWLLIDRRELHDLVMDIVRHKGETPGGDFDRYVGVLVPIARLVPLSVGGR